MSDLREDNPLTILEGKHVMSTIVFLAENGPCMKSDIYAGVSRGNRMPDKLDSLRQLGLVDYGGPSDARPTIGLTELGAEVASMLHAIDLAIRNRDTVRWPLQTPYPNSLHPF